MEAGQTQTPVISLVLPAYNEEDNLRDAVAQAIPPLRAIDPAWELILVNDASTDKTGAIADELARNHSPHIQVIHHAGNQKLGASLRHGFDAARGSIIAYCDSDLPFDMWELHRAWLVLDAMNADMVAGIRENRAGEGPHRIVYSIIYNRLVSALYGLRLEDVNFSLKMFRRDALRRMNLGSSGSFIDAEMYIRARELGLRVETIRVHYTPRTRGQSTLARPSVIVDILRELARRRMRKP
ncbi:MAG: Undecaprenyl-phosphate 4-deoxy-4-formamido-L-arabinose transferase [Myxococcota bacterium]|nr:Undecaprenyl-phosphate 4-deoxy-4-formamido-L-arabinose transferase [Myxococcota bacterium]